ncbi:hypothetical protein BD289DRAFT_230678 [Coniella lustricola]|uniref:Uncharacterized protein n=1 Tax=Coniella lustricola TaxID=2025994 RepID=A0A2T3AAB3_9PEZI|nr:hypothetical protein BD289DRAFT_230678 [Coniella lustricola]
MRVCLAARCARLPNKSRLYFHPRDSRDVLEMPSLLRLLCWISQLGFSPQRLPFVLHMLLIDDHTPRDHHLGPGTLYSMHSDRPGSGCQSSPPIARQQLPRLKEGVTVFETITHSFGHHVRSEQIPRQGPGPESGAWWLNLLRCLLMGVLMVLTTLGSADLLLLILNIRPTRPTRPTTAVNS